MIPLVLGVLVALAGAMASAIALFIRWAAECRTVLRAAVVVFLLLMMVGMLLGALVYELDPNRSTAVDGLWLASVVMSASVAIVFVAFLREARRLAAGASPAPGTGLSRFVPAVVSLVFASEALMGWTFGLAAGSLPRPWPADGTAALTLFGQIVVSPWFAFPMVAEMALSLAWLRGSLGSPLARLVAVQPAVMLCAPPVFSAPLWVLGATVGSSLSMALALAYLVLLVHRGRRLPPRVPAYAGALVLSFAVMAGGLALWAVDGSLLLYSVSVVAQMVIFLAVVLVPSSAVPVAGPVRDPPWRPTREIVPESLAGRAGRAGEERTGAVVSTARR